LKSLSLSLRGVLCCIAVGGIPLFNCAWLVARAGVLCCIVVGGDPRTPSPLRSASPLRLDLFCVYACCAHRSRGETPEPFLSLSLSLSLSVSNALACSFANFPSLRDIHEATNHVAVLCVCVLENHVFLGTRIDQKISARHVFLSTKHNCEPLSVVQHQTVFS